MIRAVTDSKLTAINVIMPKPRKKHFPILLLMAVALSELALPAEAQAGPNVGQQQLASNYMGAVRAKDRTRLQALLHPKVAACQSASTREYFDYLANQSLERAAGELQGHSYAPGTRRAAGDASGDHVQILSAANPANAN